MAVPLQYARPEAELRRPWYLWLGAGMASAWLMTWAAAALYGMIHVFMARGTDPWLPLVMLVGLALLLCTMTLILEWRAVFRRSANAALMVGTVLGLPAILAGVGELYALMRREPLTDIAMLAGICTSMTFCVWAHFRWAKLVTDWITERSQMPLLQTETDEGRR